MSFSSSLVLLGLSPDFTPEQFKEAMIPKIVYYTHEDKKQKKIFSKTISFNKRNNPELKFIFYDDQRRRNFIKKYYPEFYKFYIQIHPDYGAVKADIFRVLILYHYGGIYIDIKTRIVNIYDKIKNKPICLSSYDDTLMYFYNKITGFEVSNFFISTEKKGKVISHLKDEMYYRLNNFGKIKFPLKYILLPGNNISGLKCVFFNTSPGLFNYIASKYSNVTIIRDKKYIVYDSETTFTYRILNHKLIYKNRYHLSKNKMLNM